ncbi:hypothetical protein HPP92_002342 [Vanilla planifolia]|uniref:FHA domain-containing protein n=1 Tax=Vanilla planifolia TaxID=51239 RepID=A0A835RT27_VANPL|nr:hypothetical protein HPP92_002726 [Vanilla planifolia]KAG0502270.1 hypothetical protein HPP92_002342 [Vanilla planifolia]
MASPILMISITKGCKEGETVECNPRSTIRIGRIVRGNTLAIKDPGISQKHLILQFLPEIARWVVTDLGSSNGTCINGGLITPDAPYPLADGDVIKIGEKTVISVIISAPAVEPVAVPRHGRPPRYPKGVVSQVELEDKEDVEEENARRAKGREGG